MDSFDKVSLRQHRADEIPQLYPKEDAQMASMHHLHDATGAAEDYLDAQTASGNLISVILTSPEAQRAASVVFTAAGLTRGAASGPRSVYVFRANEPLGGTNRYTGLDLAPIMEVRGGDSGEAICLQCFEQAEAVYLPCLVEALNELAAVSITAQYWRRVEDPQAAIAWLIEGLLRSGRTLTEAERFFEALAVASQVDPELLISSFWATEARLVLSGDVGEDLHWCSRLADSFGTAGWGVVVALLQWLGTASQDLEEVIWG